MKKAKEKIPIDRQKKKKVIQRSKKRTARAKKKLAAKLWIKYNGNVTRICKEIGITYSTFYRWLAQDKRFLEAIVASEGSLNDKIRQKLIELALKGNMTAIIFYLRKRHPDFTDKPTGLVQLNLAGPMEVKFIKDGEEPKPLMSPPKPPRLPKNRQKLIEGIKKQVLEIGPKKGKNL